MLNIILPMAGLGSRFTEVGYTLPKPFIPIHGVPMIKVVVDNLTPSCEHRFIFVCQRAHLHAFNLEKTLPTYAKNVEILAIDTITEGQVCTALLAKKFFDNDEPLMSANADQYIDINIDEYLESMESRKLDGMIMTMHSQDPKWSYAKTNEQGLVVETAEKKVISHHATTGIFNFARGRDLVRAATQMIADNVRINGEFYTCPCYNYLIKEGSCVGIYSVGEEFNGMYGLGTPGDLEFFINHPISQRVISS